MYRFTLSKIFILSPPGGFRWVVRHCRNKFAAVPLRLNISLNLSINLINGQSSWQHAVIYSKCILKVFKILIFQALMYYLPGSLARQFEQKRPQNMNKCKRINPSVVGYCMQIAGKCLIAYKLSHSELWSTYDVYGLILAIFFWPVEVSLTTLNYPQNRLAVDLEIPSLRIAVDSRSALGVGGVRCLVGAPPALWAAGERGTMTKAGRPLSAAALPWGRAAANAGWTRTPALGTFWGTTALLNLVKDVTGQTSIITW